MAEKGEVSRQSVSKWETGLVPLALGTCLSPYFLIALGLPALVEDPEECRMKTAPGHLTGRLFFMDGIDNQRQKIA